MPSVTVAPQRNAGTWNGTTSEAGARTAGSLERAAERVNVPLFVFRAIWGGL